MILHNLCLQSEGDYGLRGELDTNKWLSQAYSVKLFRNSCVHSKVNDRIERNEKHLLEAIAPDERAVRADSGLV